MAIAATVDEFTLRWPEFGRYLVELEAGTCSPASAILEDETLAEQVGAGTAPATLRIWQNGPCLVLPSRLRAGATGSMIDAEGREWPICARSSGGAVVAHGPGTLNMSLIVPLRSSCPSIDASYRLWIAVLDAALRRTYGLKVDAELIEGSFCSGHYDAAIDGRKLAGIAQARRRRSVLVHGTILVDVEPERYLRLIEAAEEHVGPCAAGGPYDSNLIVSLRELLSREVSVCELAAAIARTAEITVIREEAHGTFG